MPPMMARPRPKTAWIVAKKVTRVATPGTGVHDKEINIEDTPVADNQVIDSNIYSSIINNEIFIFMQVQISDVVPDNDDENVPGRI